MKLCISVTTYNRPAQLLAQLKELERQLTQTGYDAHVFIIDDGSERSYQKVTEYLKGVDYGCRFQRFTHRQGKRFHWRLINHAFQWYQKQKFDYAIHLQDDLILHRDFVEDAISQFNLIQHPEKVCLNYVLEESRNGVSCWTPAPARRVKVGKLEVYRVGWVELHFIANRKFFERLNFCIYPIPESRWIQDSTLSSGVGRQISKRLFQAGAGMFQVTGSLATHGTEKSLMNPQERKTNPLRSI